MAYNSVFPATYPQYYPTYQPTYQTPVQPAAQPYQAQYQQPAQQAPQSSSRTVEVFQVANEKSVYDFPSSAGTTSMFIANDDSFVAFKSVSVTGQVSAIFYDKRPPAPAEKPVDMTLYVTRDELETRLAALSVSSKRPVKRETEAVEA